VFGDQIGARRFIAVRTSLNERGLASADVRPTNYSCVLQGFHYTFD